jgi:hypothetical protein
VTVEDRSYGGRKVIRGLADCQQRAIAEKLDKFGKVTLS